MGRAAYFTNEWGLPPTAREEAEQRKHENDDQDDPENAQLRHLLPGVVVSLQRDSDREGFASGPALVSAKCSRSLPARRGTTRPSSTVTRVEEVPHVQVSPARRVFAPVACEALRPSTVTRASASMSRRTSR